MTGSADSGKGTGDENGRGTKKWARLLWATAIERVMAQNRERRGMEFEQAFWRSRSCLAKAHVFPSLHQCIPEGVFICVKRTQLQYNTHVSQSRGESGAVDLADIFVSWIGTPDGVSADRTFMGNLLQSLGTIAKPILKKHSKVAPANDSPTGGDSPKKGPEMKGAIVREFKNQKGAIIEKVPAAVKKVPAAVKKVPAAVKESPKKAWSKAVSLAEKVSGKNTKVQDTPEGGGNSKPSDKAEKSGDSSGQATGAEEEDSSGQATGADEEEPYIPHVPLWCKKAMDLYNAHGFVSFASKKPRAPLVHTWDQYRAAVREFRACNAEYQELRRTYAEYEAIRETIEKHDPNKTLSSCLCDIIVKERSKKDSEPDFWEYEFKYEFRNHGNYYPVNNPYGIFADEVNDILNGLKSEREGFRCEAEQPQDKIPMLSDLERVMTYLTCRRARAEMMASRISAAHNGIAALASKAKALVRYQDKMKASGRQSEDTDDEKVGADNVKVLEELAARTYRRYTMVKSRSQYILKLTRRFKNMGNNLQKISDNAKDNAPLKVCKIDVGKAGDLLKLCGLIVRERESFIDRMRHRLQRATGEHGGCRVCLSCAIRYLVERYLEDMRKYRADYYAELKSMFRGGENNFRMWLEKDEWKKHAETLQQEDLVPCLSNECDVDRCECPRASCTMYHEPVLVQSDTWKHFNKFMSERHSEGEDVSVKTIQAWHLKPAWHGSSVHAGIDIDAILFDRMRLRGGELVSKTSAARLKQRIAAGALKRNQALVLLDNEGDQVLNYQGKDNVNVKVTVDVFDHAMGYLLHMMLYPAAGALCADESVDKGQDGSAEVEEVKKDGYTKVEDFKKDGSAEEKVKKDGSAEVEEVKKDGSAEVDPPSFEDLIGKEVEQVKKTLHTTSFVDRHDDARGYHGLLNELICTVLNEWVDKIGHGNDWLSKECTDSIVEKWSQRKKPDIPSLYREMQSESLPNFTLPNVNLLNKLCCHTRICEKVLLGESPSKSARHQDWRKFVEQWSESVSEMVSSDIMYRVLMGGSDMGVLHRKKTGQLTLKPLSAIKTKYRNLIPEVCRRLYNALRLVVELPFFRMCDRYFCRIQCFGEVVETGFDVKKDGYGLTNKISDFIEVPFVAVQSRLERMTPSKETGGWPATIEIPAVVHHGSRMRPGVLRRSVFMDRVTLHQQSLMLARNTNSRIDVVSDPFGVKATAPYGWAEDVVFSIKNMWTMTRMIGGDIFGGAQGHVSSVSKPVSKAKSMKQDIGDTIADQDQLFGDRSSEAYSLPDLDHIEVAQEESPFEGAMEASADNKLHSPKSLWPEYHDRKGVPLSRKAFRKSIDIYHCESLVHDMSIKLDTLPVLPSMFDKKARIRRLNIHMAAHSSALDLVWRSSVMRLPSLVPGVLKYSWNYVKEFLDTYRCTCGICELTLGNSYAFPVGPILKLVRMFPILSFLVPLLSLLLSALQEEVGDELDEINDAIQEGGSLPVEFGDLDIPQPHQTEMHIRPDRYEEQFLSILRFFISNQNQISRSIHLDCFLSMTPSLESVFDVQESVGRPLADILPSDCHERVFAMDVANARPRDLVGFLYPYQETIREIVKMMEMNLPLGASGQFLSKLTSPDVLKEMVVAGLDETPDFGFPELPTKNFAKLPGAMRMDLIMHVIQREVIRRTLGVSNDVRPGQKELNLCQGNMNDLANYRNSKSKSREGACLNLVRGLDFHMTHIIQAKYLMSLEESLSKNPGWDLNMAAKDDVTSRYSELLQIENEATMWAAKTLTRRARIASRFASSINLKSLFNWSGPSMPSSLKRFKSAPINVSRSFADGLKQMSLRTRPVMKIDYHILQFLILHLVFLPTVLVAYGAQCTERMAGPSERSSTESTVDTGPASGSGLSTTSTYPMVRERAAFECLILEPFWYVGLFLSLILWAVVVSCLEVHAAKGELEWLPKVVTCGYRCCKGLPATLGLYERDKENAFDDDADRHTVLHTWQGSHIYTRVPHLYVGWALPRAVRKRRLFMDAIQTVPEILTCQPSKWGGFDMYARCRRYNKKLKRKTKALCCKILCPCTLHKKPGTRGARVKQLNSGSRFRMWLNHPTPSASLFGILGCAIMSFIVAMLPGVVFKDQSTFYHRYGGDGEWRELEAGEALAVFLNYIYVMPAVIYATVVLLAAYARMRSPGRLTKYGIECERKKLEQIKMPDLTNRGDDFSRNRECFNSHPTEKSAEDLRMDILSAIETGPGLKRSIRQAAFIEAVAIPLPVLLAVFAGGFVVIYIIIGAQIQFTSVIHLFLLFVASFLCASGSNYYAHLVTSILRTFEVVGISQKLLGFVAGSTDLTGMSHLQGYARVPRFKRLTVENLRGWMQLRRFFLRHEWKEEMLRAEGTLSAIIISVIAMLLGILYMLLFTEGLQFKPEELIYEPIAIMFAMIAVFNLVILWVILEIVASINEQKAHHRQIIVDLKMQLTAAEWDMAHRNAVQEPPAVGKSSTNVEDSHVTEAPDGATIVKHDPPKPEPKRPRMRRQSSTISLGIPEYIPPEIKTVVKEKADSAGKVRGESTKRAPAESVVEVARAEQGIQVAKGAAKYMESVIASLDGETDDIKQFGITITRKRIRWLNSIIVSGLVVVLPFYQQVLSG